MTTEDGKDTLPSVLRMDDLTKILDRSRRSVERLRRSGAMPDPLPFLAGRAGRVT
jgi:hypothetical protein